MNISSLLKDKRDKESRQSITSGHVSLKTFEDDLGNDFEIIESDRELLPDMVNSINGLMGAINIIPGDNIIIDVIAPNTIRISSTGGGGPVDPDPEPSGDGKFEIGLNFIELSGEYDLYKLEGGIIKE